MDDKAIAVALVVLSAMAIAAAIWWKIRLDPQQQAAVDDERVKYGKRLRELYGEPKLSVWTLWLPVLMYEEFMVMDKVKIAYGDVKEVSFNNGNSLYGNGEYQVQVRTILPKHEFLYANVGNDPMVAQDLIVLISRCVAEQHFVEPESLAWEAAVGEE